MDFAQQLLAAIPPGVWHPVAELVHSADERKWLTLDRSPVTYDDVRRLRARGMVNTAQRSFDAPGAENRTWTLYVRRV